MADVVNLRQARKARERALREQTAAEKRRLFGRTKARKLTDAAEKERTERLLAGHRRDDETR
jgi:hypothetical protein